MITPNIFNNRVIDRAGKMGKDACQIMASAIRAVEPYQCVKQQLKISDDQIFIGQQSIPQNKIDRIFLIGFGKASVPMAKAVIDVLGDRLMLAEVITKDKGFLINHDDQAMLQVHIGGHPIPTNASIMATQSVLNDLPEFSPRDLVLVVISGGGSALFTAPLEDITQDDLQKMTDSLIKSGAEIQEINTIRKHIDQVKGGRLAARLSPAMVHTLILSDVIGDRLDMIASGPTVPDPTTFTDAWNVIQKYDLVRDTPASITHLIQSGLKGEIAETLKQRDFSNMQVQNHLVGTNIKAALAAKEQAEALGYHALVVSTHLTGLTKDVAEFISGIIQTELTYEQPVKKPYCLIMGGETTVKITGDGLGGRNQDLALRMVPYLAGLKDILFISLATDGEDGPTDAAGAASDAIVFRDGAVMLGLNIDTYIITNNSYKYFEKTGGLIKTGSTGTNVNDLIFVLANDQVED